MEIKGQFYSLRFGKTDLDCLEKLITICSDSGINTVFLEIEKGMKYDSIPEISAPWAIPKTSLSHIINYAKSKYLNIIPVVPTFSHCNYFLKFHPEFCEAGSNDIYCAGNPAVYNIVFAMLKEIIELFEPDSLHIGHDEAISSYNFYTRKSIFKCPICREKEGYNIFANDIINIYSYLKSYNIKTMMWADMLIDPSRFKGKCFDRFGCYGGIPDKLGQAIDLLPKDIVMCDWHYEVAKEYPSINYLQTRGFNVLGTSKFPVNTYLFTNYAQNTKSKNFKGMIGTCWNHINKQTYPYLSKWTRHNGKCFNGKELSAYTNKTVNKIKKNIKESVIPLGPGDFHKTFSFNISEPGIYYSKGWTDFFYKEYPNSKEDKIMPPSKINSLKLKAGRQGIIEYEFRTKDKTHFKKLNIRVWMINSGLNSVEIKAGNAENYLTIAKNKTLSGNNLNISEYVKGTSKVRVKFYAKNLDSQTLTSLQSFILSGVVNQPEK